MGMTTATAAMIFPSLVDPRSPGPARSLVAYPNPSTSLSNFSFHDFLSIINPLQHLPVVSTIYRAVTGDTIKPLERVAGDALYGGLWGFVSSVANVAFEEITGKDIGATALAFVENHLSTSDMAAKDSAPAAPSGTTLASASAPSTAAPGVATGAPAQLSALAPIAAPQTMASQAVASQTTAPAPSAPAPSLASLSAPVVPPPVTTPSPQPAKTGNQAAAALMRSMNNKGVDAALSQRAMAAYQKSLATPPAQPVPTS
jgi:hypothetical protein